MTAISDVLVDGQDVPKQAFRDLLTGYESEFTSLNSTVASYGTNITSLNATTTALITDMSEVQGTVAQQGKDATSAGSNIVSLNTQVASLEGNLTSTQTSVTSLQTTVATLASEAAVVSLQTTVATLASEATSAGANITGLNSQVAALETNAETVGALFTSLQASVSIAALTLYGSAFTSEPGFNLAMSAGRGEATLALAGLPFTAECRVKGATASVAQVAVGQYPSFWIGCDASDNATAHFYVNSPNVAEYSVKSSVSITDGNWHHLAVVVTSTGVNLWVDGVLAGSNSTAGSYSSAYPLGVRDFAATLAGNNPWLGAVDEVAIWSTAKYTATFTPPSAPYVGVETGLVALYHLDGDGVNASNLAGSLHQALVDIANLRQIISNLRSAGVSAMFPVPGPGLSLIGPSFTTDGAFGPALSGGHGEEVTGPITGLPFTVEARVQGSADGQPQVAVGQAYLFWMGCDASGNATAHYYFGEPGGSEYSIATGVSITDGNWHHLAFVVAASGASLWVDGTNVGSNNNAAGYYNAFPFGVRDFGFVGPDGPNAWAGAVDEVAVWSTARYSATFNPPSSPYTGTETGLLSLFHLDGSGIDAKALAALPIGTRPADTGLARVIGVRFYLQPGDSVTYTVQPAGASPNSLPASQFIASYSGTGPNWDEPFESTLMLFIKAVSGTPVYRWI